MLSEEGVVRHLMVEDGDGGPINGDEVLVCPFDGCGKQFKWKKNLQVHVRVNHVNPGAFPCTVEGCGLSFGYRHVLARHIKLIHVEGRRHRSTLAITKNIIGSVVKAIGKRRLDVDESDPDAVARAVAAAMVEEGGRKPPTNIVRCAFEGCDKTFKGNSNMKAHFRVCHLVCPVIDCIEPTCGAKFSYRHVMLRHHDNIHVKGKRTRISIISKREMEAAASTNKPSSAPASSGGSLNKNMVDNARASYLSHRPSTSAAALSGMDDDASVSSNGSDEGTPMGLEGSSEIPGLRSLNGPIVMNVNTINAAGAGVGGGMGRNNNIQHYTNRLEAQFLHSQQQQQQQDYNSYVMVMDQQQQQGQQLPSLQNAPFNNSGAMLLQHQAAMLNSNYQPLQVLSYHPGGSSSSGSGAGGGAPVNDTI